MKTKGNGVEDENQAQRGITKEIHSKTEPQHSTLELDENNNPVLENEPSSTKTNTSGSSFPPLQNHAELVNTCLAKISENPQGYLATKILYTLAHLLPSPSKIPKPLLFALHTEESVSATVKALQLIRRSLIITDHGFHYSIESQLQDAIICNLKNSNGKNNINLSIFDRKIFRNFKRFLVSLSNSKSDSLYSEAIENALHFTMSTLSNVVSNDDDVNNANGSKQITAEPLELAHYVAWEVRESHMEKSAALYKKLIEYYTQKYTKVSNSNSNSNRLAAQNSIRDEKIEIQMDLWLCKNNLAIVLRSLKNFKESHQILIDILDKEEKVLGRRHPLTMTTIHELLEIQKEFQMDDTTSGSTTTNTTEESVEINSKTSGHYHDNLARIRFNRENYKSAVRTVEKIAPRRLEILGPRQQDYERNVILRSKSLPKIAEVSKYNSRRSSSMLGFGLGSGVFPQYFKAICKTDTDEGHWTASSTSLSSTNLPKKPGSTGFSGTLRRSYSFREPRPCAMHDAVPLNVRAKLLAPAKSVEVLNTGTTVKTHQKRWPKTLRESGPSIENLRTVQKHSSKILQTPRISSDKQIKTPSSIKALQVDCKKMDGKPLTNFSQNSTKQKCKEVSELLKTA